MIIHVLGCTNPVHRVAPSLKDSSTTAAATNVIFVMTHLNNLTGVQLRDHSLIARTV